MTDQSEDIASLREHVRRLERRAALQFTVLMVLVLMLLMGLALLGTSYSRHLQAHANTPSATN